MSRIKRDRHSKKLQNLLSRADDEQFCHLVWAVNALQTDRQEVAKRYIKFPNEAATSDISSRLAIRPWDLETLVNHLLTTPKARRGKGRRRLTNCFQFHTAACAANYLRGLENEEASLYLNRFGVLNEMHRIAQRQFQWQRGYANAAQFYRYAFIYGQGDCKAYFEKTYGLSFNHFSLAGFALFAGLQNSPLLSRNLNLEEMGVSSEDVRATLELVSAPIPSARVEALRMNRAMNERSGNPVPIAYRPSFLRRFPIVAFGSSTERLRSPLPELIVQRITSGLYYDLASGPPNLRNEASDRFEDYSAKYLAEMLDSFQISRQRKYRLGKRQFDTPDILIKKSGEIVVVIECKATKLSYEAQFAEDPFNEAKRAYDEIAKAVFQLWRFFSHTRREIYVERVRANAHGIVLTLDPWMTMSHELRERVLCAANEMADDEGICPEDRRPVTFSYITDLENMLSCTNERTFLSTLEASKEDQFAGWQLSSVQQEVSDQAIDQKDFAFEIAEVLPWWELAGSL